MKPVGQVKGYFRYQPEDGIQDDFMDVELYLKDAANGSFLQSVAYFHKSGVSYTKLMVCMTSSSAC